MKIKRLHLSNRLEGFTIWELCIAIAVVAVFVALLFPHITSCRDSPRASSTSETKAIVNAIGNYRQDYNHYPQIGKPRREGEKFVVFGTKAAGCLQSNGELFDVLRGISRGANTGHALNPKQVKYYEWRKATGSQSPRNGFADGPDFAPGVQGCLFDEWGSEYCVVFETDGDELLDLSSIYTDLTGEENFVRYPVVAFSLGKDGKVGGKGYEGRYRKAKSTEVPDDVVSW